MGINSTSQDETMQVCCLEEHCHPLLHILLVYYTAEPLLAF
jgi:hypothetical protein